MPQIGYTARSFITNRLLDAHTGFNYWFPLVSKDYDNVDVFTLSQGTNLFIGSFTAPQIDQTGDGTYPMAMVYSSRSNNLNQMVTPGEFAGPVITMVDFWTSFPSGGPPTDPESIQDAIEDAMVETFNRMDYGFYSQEAFPGLTYNNQMNVVRNGISSTEGQNWLQLMQFTIVHNFLTSGR